VRPLNLLNFIERSKQAHGEYAYSYENVVLVSTKIKVTLKCLTCLTLFEVTPNNHLNPSNLTGCRKCGHKRGATLRTSQNSAPRPVFRLTHSQYLERARQFHGEDYDLSEVIYSRMVDRIIVKCNKHKTNSTPTAKNFLTKGACKACANERLQEANSISFDEFERRADLTHGVGRYELDRSSFTKLIEHVTIRCLKCDLTFSQRASHHVIGQGCPECNRRCFISKGETEWLDSLGIPSKCRNVWVRLTCGRRVNVDALVDRTVYEYYGTNIHGDPRKHAPDGWSKLLGKTYGEVHRDTLEREDLLRRDGFSLIAMWELDWKLSRRELAPVLGSTTLRT
jgi:predicted  nucleic acid-binding Zn-ribbon protein